MLTYNEKEERFYLNDELLNPNDAIRIEIEHTGAGITTIVNYMTYYQGVIEIEMGLSAQTVEIHESEIERVLKY